MGATVKPGSVSVLFDDQSNMKIKTAGPATILGGGKVKFVHESKAEFKIDFEDGSNATLLSLLHRFSILALLGT